MFVKISYFLSEYMGAMAFIAIAAYVFYLISKKNEQTIHAIKIYQKSQKLGMTEAPSLYPKINKALCIGCGSCVTACPEGPIIQLLHQKAVLVQPTKCVGHGACEEVCPVNAITLVFGSKQNGREVPLLSEDFETNVAGLYIAGELGGMGLVKNAMTQGAIAVEHAIKNTKRLPNQIDLLIVGAGPAGISASLKAKQMGARYVCIDQEHFGGSVYQKYPKGKVVMIQPVKVPIVGKIKYPSNKISKEQLLAHWAQIIAKQKLNIRHGVKFNSLERLPNGSFKIQTSKGLLIAGKVVLAMGVGGTPRKLGIPNDDVPKVFYRLTDPDLFRGKHIAIVGAGNSAIEAAQMLCAPHLRNRVVLLVRAKDINKANEENRHNILMCERKGWIKILYSTTIKEISPQAIVIDADKKTFSIQNDAIFVFAGADLPFKFLESLGVKITMKFGESLSSNKGRKAG